MKSIRFLRNVPDKYTGEQYIKGQVKEFEDERADEILNARQENGKPYAEEVAKEKDILESKEDKEETKDETPKAEKNKKKKAE